MFVLICTNIISKSKIPDLNIIHESPDIYNVIFAKVKDKLTDLKFS